jgi:hypothetical protein
MSTTSHLTAACNWQHYAFTMGNCMNSKQAEAEISEEEQFEGMVKQIFNQINGDLSKGIDSKEVEHLTPRSSRNASLGGGELHLVRRGGRGVQEVHR